jgi:flagellar basal-body rod protein FlgG
MGKYIAQRRLEMIANNIANSLTPGFKSARAVINISQSANTEGEEDRIGLEGAMVNILDTYIDLSGAPLIQTGNTFDFALEGNGFFVISTREGLKYTRNGNFHLDNNKRLVTTNGDPVMGDGGEITIPASTQDIKVEEDGTIVADGIPLNKIKVVDLQNRNRLKYAGGGLFVNEDRGNLERPSEGYSIRQGFYEASNVDTMKEMVNLISAMRAYEAYTKIDDSISDVTGKLINMGR